jgi:hypothetical protein
LSDERVVISSTDQLSGIETQDLQNRSEFKRSRHSDETEVMLLSDSVNGSIAYLPAAVVSTFAPQTQVILLDEEDW